MTARALVVAVPHTKLPDLPVLDGAPGDAAAVEDLLTSRGFTVTAFKGGLTTMGLIDELLALRKETVADDLALVYVSGHGYHLPDVDGDEPDHMDECLVLSDGLLRDDWFANAFWPKAAAGSWWVTCADTCFSASVFRRLDVDESGIPDSSTRPLPSLQTPTGPARIWLGAAGDTESALQIKERDKVYSWYSRQFCQLVNGRPGLNYRQLWCELQKKWLAERQAGRETLAMPRMCMTVPAEPLANRAAFASLEFQAP